MPNNIVKTMARRHVYAHACVGRQAAIAKYSESIHFAACHRESAEPLSRTKRYRAELPLSLRSRTALGLVLALLALQPVSAQPLAAQAFDFGASEDIAAKVEEPVSGDQTWNLNGDGIHLSKSVIIDNSAEMVALTINGNGHTLNLNFGNGGYGWLVSKSQDVGDFGAPVTLNLTDVTITGGKSAEHGGAILTNGDLIVSLSGAVAFSGNSTGGANGGVSGGVAFAGGDILFAGIGDLVMENNEVDQGGGGAVASAGGDIRFETEGNIRFSDNESLSSDAGAIDARSGSIYFGEKTKNVIIENNHADGASGGLYAKGGQMGAEIIFEGSGAVTLSGNTAAGDSGAIGVHGDLTFANKGAVIIAGNIAHGGNGGAIWSAGSVWFAQSTGDVTLDGNQSKYGGGGIIAEQTVEFANQGALTVVGNQSGLSGFGEDYAPDNGGGGINAIDVDIRSIGPVTFSGNSSGGNGGAIYSGHKSPFHTVWDGSVTLENPAQQVTFERNHATFKGGAIYSDGDVTLSTETGSISFSGNTAGERANAIYMDNPLNKTVPAQAKLSLHAGSDPAREGTITFFDPIENNAANGPIAVVKTGDGLLSFDASKYEAEADRWSKIYGATDVQAGTFEVANNAIFGVLSEDVPQPEPLESGASSTGGAAATSFATAAGTTVQGGVAGEIRADVVTLNGDLDIAGRQPQRRSILTITSHNLTFGGGNIHFNAVANDGVTQDRDLLVLNLNGTEVSGRASVTVANLGGPDSGAYTPGNGIQLVQTNDGVTPDDTFSLVGDVLIAGAYAYRLHRGAVDGSETDANNWYLRSLYAPPDIDPDDGDDDKPVPPDTDPEIQPGTPVATAVMPLALTYGYAMLDTLHERIGETYTQPVAPVTEQRTVWCKDPSTGYRCTVKVPTADDGSARLASSGWARLIGNRGSHKPGRFMRLGPDYDYTFGGIQAGLDVYAREQPDGTLDKAGFYAGYGQISSDVKGQGGAKAGKVDMDAYTFGAYWTHFAPQGWYTDAVLQATWYTTDASTVAGQRIKPDGFGILGSLEGGYKFDLGSGFTLEPQAQVVYQNVSFDTFGDGRSLYRFSDGDSLRGRLGMRLSKTWTTITGTKPRLITGWLRANVWHEFMGDTETTTTTEYGYDAFVLPSSLGGTWGEIGAGVTAQLSDTINMFATASYSRSLDNKDDSAWDGRLGMTVKW